MPGPGFLSLPGIERVRLFDGKSLKSPIEHLTGARLTQVGHGMCTWSMPASPWFQTQMGFFLNGVTALVADFALGGAILTGLPPWAFPVTSDINFTYLRPVRVDAGKLIARSKLIDLGRNQGTAEALIEDAEGRILAHATTRCFVRTVEPQQVTFSPTESAEADGPDPYERPLSPELAYDVSDLSDLSGLEIARMIVGGDVPLSPWNLFTGVRLREVAHGKMSATFPASPWFQSAAGTIYGGLLAFVADSLTTGAATTVLEPRTATASLDLNIHFLRPGIADGSLLTGSGEVLHGGKGLIVARSEVSSADGKPLVLATGSFMRRSIRDWVPVVVKGDPFPSKESQ